MTQNEKDSLYTLIESNQGESNFMMRFNHTDSQRIIPIINQGIDSYLEACLVPSRGDSYAIDSNSLSLNLSAQSLCCFIRRLIESEDGIMNSLANEILGIIQIKNN